MDLGSISIPTIIATIVIPFIVNLLKKIKLPSKWAPVAAIVLASLFVIAANVFNIPGVQFDTVFQAIVAALGISGASVLGYDVLKKMTDTTTATK